MLHRRIGESDVPSSPRTGRRTPRLVLLLLFLLSLLIGAGSLAFHFQQHTPVRAASAASMGLNIDFNEQSLVDMVQNQPRFQDVSGISLTQDDNGWPTSDFCWVIDNRYTYAWINGAVNIDPLKRSTDISGTYKISFTGQATLASTGDDPAHGGTTITNQAYDAATNTTTADMNVPNPAGGVLAVIEFHQTKRTATSAAGTGITNMKAIRPGYAANTTQVFTNEWLSNLTNHKWAAFRWMGALGTNDYANPATDQTPHNELYPIKIQWPTDRRIPNAGPLYGANHRGVHGMPWEYVVLIAQITHKDQWVNIPVNASDDYVAQVANLLKNGNAFTGNKGVPDDVHIYVEYSNEMWHYGFSQGPWNNLAAQDEVKAGGSNLNYDNSNNGGDQWRFRRIARRTLEIGDQFKAAFNDNGTRIRPVVDNAFLYQYEDLLNYVKNNYGGVVSNKLYGISQTGYYSSSDKSSVDAIIAGEKTNSDSNTAGYQQITALAHQFGLESMVYEGGQDEEGNKTPTSPVDTALPNQFAASRDPRMQDVTVHDFTNWSNSGGGLYMQFGHVGRSSTYGMWGLSEDVNDQTTGKWKGVDQILGGAIPPVPTPQPTTQPTVQPTPGTPVPPSLPAPWQTQDVGSVGVTGSGSFLSSFFTLAGSGTDIWGNADGFRYVYQPLNGDGTIIARVTAIQNTDAWAKAGVMIRESLNGDSSNALMTLTSANGASFQRRTSTGGVSTFTSGPNVSPSYWVKLVRSGDSFMGSVSSDGANWTQVGSDTISMGTQVYVGLAVTSHNNTVLNTSSFADVSVTASAPPPPPTGNTLFSTGFENGQAQPAWVNTVDSGGFSGGTQNVGGICCGVTGPEADTRSELAHTGSTALMYSGMDNSSSTSYAYLKVLDLSGPSIAVVGNSTQLDYWIYPQDMSLTSGNNSTCVAVDLIFSDGSNLRDSGATDQNGHRVHPAYQCNNLTLNTWNHVVVNLGSVATGKTVARINVGYDQGANTGGYRGYIDDISLHN